MKKTLKFGLMLLLLVVFFSVTKPNLANAAEKDSYNTEANVGFYGEYPEEPNAGTDVSGDNNTNTSKSNFATSTQKNPKLPQTSEKNNIYLIGLGFLLIYISISVKLKNVTITKK